MGAGGKFQTLFSVAGDVSQQIGQIMYIISSWSSFHPSGGICISSKMN